MKRIAIMIIVLLASFSLASCKNEKKQDQPAAPAAKPAVGDTATPTAKPTAPQGGDTLSGGVGDTPDEVEPEAVEPDEGGGEGDDMEAEEPAEDEDTDNADDM